MNSLLIDLQSPMEGRVPPAVHDHFSIRGFVSGMRKKDPKICYPFSPKADGTDTLPPLVVPNFQWWQCASERSRREDKGGLSESGDDHEGKYLCNATVNSKIISSKSIESSKGKTKEGNSCADVPEAKRLHSRDTSKTTPAGSSQRLVPSVESDEPEDLSSGSEKTLSATPQKRKPKLRFLADILIKERNPASENPRPRVQVTSTETEPLTGGSQNQLKVPVEAAKGIRSKSKRKISREEDRGPLVKTTPNSEVSKRLKGDAEGTCRVVQISDSTESDDHEVRAKIPRMKPKKSKALDITNKMTRAQSDNRTPPITELPKADSQSSNIQTYAIFGKSGETGQQKSFLFGQQLERMSTLSKSNRPEVEAGGISFMPPNKTTLGDSNGKGKMPLDLSLNSFGNGERNSSSKQPLFRPNNNRGIPDLNETFTQKTNIDSEKRSFDPQRSFNLEKSFHLQKNMDMSLSPAEFQRQLIDPENQTAPASNCYNVDQVKASELAVVELLASHKRDKELKSFRKNQQPIRIDSTTGGSHPLYPNGQFPFLNRTSATTMENSNANKQSDFSVFPTSNPFHQRKAPHSAPSTSTLQGPRTSGAGPEMLWRPRTDYVGPFNFQSRPTSVVPISSSGSYKGKTVSDIKGIEEIRTIQEPCSQLKEGRIGSSSTSARSYDSFSNDAATAMQLLSMMNQGIVSNSPYKASSRGFLDKTLSPCNYHPRVNSNGSRSFIDSSSLYLQERNLKNVPGSSNVGSCSSVQKAASMQGQRAFKQRNSKVIDLERTTNHVIQAGKKYPPLGECKLNENPADFSYVHSRNKFTLTSKDLKRKGNNASKEKLNAVAKKRQKVRKEASGSGKEHSRK